MANFAEQARISVPSGTTLQPCSRRNCDGLSFDGGLCQGCQRLLGRPAKRHV